MRFFVFAASVSSVIGRAITISPAKRQNLSLFSRTSAHPTAFPVKFALMMTFPSVIRDHPGLSRPCHLSGAHREPLGFAAPTLACHCIGPLASSPRETPHLGAPDASGLA